MSGCTVEDGVLKAHMRPDGAYIAVDTNLVLQIEGEKNGTVALLRDKKGQRYSAG